MIVVYYVDITVTTCQMLFAKILEQAKRAVCAKVYATCREGVLVHFALDTKVYLDAY